MPLDDEDLDIKKYEELYTYAKENYARERERFRSAESKVQLYASFLIVVAGIGTTAGIGKITSIISRIHDVKLPEVLFLFFYLLFAISFLFALANFIKSIEVEDLLNPAVGEEVLEYYETYDYITVLYESSRSLFEDIEVNRKVVQEKYTNAEEGLNWLKATLASAVLTIIAYVVTFL